MLSSVRERRDLGESVLKAALIHRSSDQGFALPVAVGTGLVMLLVGAILISRSQDDQITASARRATHQNLGAAETSIARYLSLIDSNRPITTYNACQSWGTSGACNDTSPTQSWATSTVPGIDSALVVAAATRNWQDIDPADSSKGQYRLVDYIYSPTQGVAPGTGTLMIESRINQGGTSTLGTGTTRLKVNVSVAPARPPGLWATNFTVIGTLHRIKANVLDSSGTSPPASDAVRPVPPNAYTSSHLGYLPSPLFPPNTVPTVTVKSQAGSPKQVRIEWK